MAVIAALLLSLAGPPVAAPAPEVVCTGTLGRERVVACALAHSPAVQAAELEGEALAGRRRAAQTRLPSNPAVEVTAAARHGLQSGDRDINVYGRLSQELEIAGQRGKRVAVLIDSAAAEFAESIQHTYGFTTTYFHDADEMFRAVRASEVQALFDDMVSLRYDIAYGGADMQIVAAAEPEVGIGLAVHQAVVDRLGHAPPRQGSRAAR